jgi:hypothetical protein
MSVRGSPWNSVVSRTPSRVSTTMGCRSSAFDRVRSSSAPSARPASSSIARPASCSRPTSSSTRRSTGRWPGRFDVESVALHETGHFLGLGHSLLGETELQANGRRSVLAKRAVMFPISYGSGIILDRTLHDDDRAGLIDVYSNTGSNRALGSISGRVTLNGSGVFGAHVTAFHTGTGAMVGSYALSDDGTFVISSLEPGTYVVRAEPLDDADIDMIFSSGTNVNIDFRPAFFSQLVPVPAGGASESIEIRVQGK